MLLITRLDDIPPLTQPCGLTIGVFDGVHLGHQSLLTSLRSQMPKNGILTVLTFSNHPSWILSPNSPTPLICPPLQKAQLLFEGGADIVILVPFTQELAEMAYETFLGTLKKSLNFTWLTLGEGAAFGKGRLGEERRVKQLGHVLEFAVEYLPKISLHHHPLSSRHIRQLIHQGALQDVEECLGRPYSLLGHLILETAVRDGKVMQDFDSELVPTKEHIPQAAKGLSVENDSGSKDCINLPSPTAISRMTQTGPHFFCPFPGICLPPDGEYLVKIKEREILPLSIQARVCREEAKIYFDGPKIHEFLGKDVYFYFPPGSRNKKSASLMRD